MSESGRVCGGKEFEVGQKGEREKERESEISIILLLLRQYLEQPNLVLFDQTMGQAESSNAKYLHYTLKSCLLNGQLQKRHILHDNKME